MKSIKLANILCIFVFFALPVHSADMHSRIAENMGEICENISRLTHQCRAHESFNDPLSFMKEYIMNNYMLIKTLAHSDSLARVCNYLVYPMNDLCFLPSLDFIFEKVAPYVSHLLGLSELYSLNDFMVHNETIGSLFSNETLISTEPNLAAAATIYNMGYLPLKLRMTLMVLVAGCNFLTQAMLSDLTLHAQVELNQTCTAVTAGYSL